MATNLERSRWTIWLLVILVLVLAFMLIWKDIEQEASDTALALVSKRLVDRASYFKQQWLLAKQPETLTIEGKQIVYSHMGWVKPINEAQQVDCEFWLEVLYQEKRVFESLPEKITDNSEGSNFRCEYFYSRGHALSMELKQDKFSVGVSFSSGYVF